MDKDSSNYILKEIQLKNGQQLVLRKPVVDDAGKMIEYLNSVGGESDNLLFGKDEFNLTIEQEMEYIKEVRNNANTLMILGIIKDTIVGVGQISSSDKKRISHNSELAISVKKDYWSIGIGSVIIQELIQFAKYNATKNISLGVKASNSKAIKLYEKFGFVKVGVHKDFFNVNEVFDDEILMDLYL